MTSTSDSTSPTSPTLPTKPIILVRKTTRGKRILRALERLLACIGLFFLIYHLGFELTVITTESMAPTLKNGDVILKERISYWFRSPARFEIVAYQNAEGLRIMKRVIAYPQEELELNQDGWVLIDGKLLERPASLASLKYYPYGNLTGGKKIRYEMGYFVLGDDSEDSLDSRFEGPLFPREVNGRAWLCVWPLSRFGFLTP